jgi:hypothetical protein
MRVTYEALSMELQCKDMKYAFTVVNWSEHSVALLLQAVV